MKPAYLAYPTGDTTAKTEVANMLRRIGSEGWGAFPAGTKLQFVESSKGGGSSLVQRELITLVEINREREKRVYTSTLDCGREFMNGRGEWIPESDPRVRAWLEKACRDIRAGGKRACNSNDLLVRADTLRDFEWVLGRNGWETP